MLRKSQHFYQTAKSKSFVSQPSSGEQTNKTMANWFASLFLAALFTFSIMACQHEQAEVEPQPSVVQTKKSARTGCDGKIFHLRTGRPVGTICIEIYYPYPCPPPCQPEIPNFKDLIDDPLEDPIEWDRTELIASIDRETVIVQVYEKPLSRTLDLQTNLVLNERMAAGLGLESSILKEGSYIWQHDQTQGTWSAIVPTVLPTNSF